MTETTLAYFPQLPHGDDDVFVMDQNAPEIPPRMPSIRRQSNLRSSRNKPLPRSPTQVHPHSGTFALIVIIITNVFLFTMTL